MLAVGIMLKLDGKAPNSILAVNLLITAGCRTSITNLKQIIFFAYVGLQIALVEVGILPKNGVPEGILSLRECGFVLE